MPTKLEANASFKKPRLVFLVLAVALIFSAVFVGGGVCGAWKDLADTKWYNDPDATEYNIETAYELAGLSKLVRDGIDFDGKIIYLVNDIDLSGHSWFSIGYIYGSGGFLGEFPFKGTFDGKGKTISNISLTIGGNEPGGLFGYVVEGGTVTNVKLENVEINVERGPVLVGSLVGILKDGNVTDCEISGNNIINPVYGASTYEGKNVTVDDVIGEIRGKNVSIYGITSTNITYDRFTEIGVSVDYKGGKNHQNHGLTYPEPTYEVIIPEELVIDETGNGTMEIKISVSGSQLPPSSIVKVYVSGDFSLEHQADSRVTLEYVLSNETVTKLSNNDLVGTFTSGNRNPIRLNATVSGPTLYSGTYTDTLTFTYGLE